LLKAITAKYPLIIKTGPFIFWLATT